MSIEGRKLLITGGTGALGRAVAAMALERGAAVAASYLLPAECTAAEAAFGGRVVLVAADLADEAQTLAAADAAAGMLGGLDGVIAIAGGFDMGPVADVDGTRFDALLSTNARSLYHTVRATLPHLRAAGGGSIVTIGARPAVAGAADMAAYAASKSAVMSLTQSLAQELLPRKIRVNAVLPSIIDTPANRAAMPDADHGAWVTPEALARVILFLTSAEAAAVSGALIPAYGHA
ncbi:SDR family NAD(P)-dependent oxidoreductase [Tistrella sp. BH-R2-4]|uniref:SDR family NAD(P)-dependent oxidoreductase n=1 Tax=Tistrella arctica TaxID=3133430 RepID=A0ABU9YH55_9PROT